MRSKSLLVFFLVLTSAQWACSKEDPDTEVPISEELVFRDIDALKAALASMTEVEVGRIDPRFYESKDQRLADRRERILDWPIADIQVLPTAQREVFGELIGGLFVEKTDKSTTMCFNPRHFIRGKIGREVVCILICFECERWKRTGFRVNQSVALNQNSEAVFEEILRSLGSVRLLDAEIPRPKEKPFGDDYKPGVPVDRAKVQVETKKN